MLLHAAPPDAGAEEALHPELITLAGDDGEVAQVGVALRTSQLDGFLRKPLLLEGLRLKLHRALLTVSDIKASLGELGRELGDACFELLFFVCDVLCGNRLRILFSSGVTSLFHFKAYCA